ncbi:DUF58 domain-containing protein [Indiicoccus explosivorum]|uniref:DUF58 domain-containing protein n=1 Tax=Indiicoccus explosivorum TaxID=1917864 RepID=UPI000B443FEB|nr:DUF58 domain-containing protein [Indiicoccus explosivorum]
MTGNLLMPAGWEGAIRRYRIVTGSKVGGRHKGTRISRQPGVSQDFSDFREYYPGDDVRLIDWNLYGRTEKYYIKRFMDEQEMRIGIILDCSKSMADKWLFARQLVCMLGLIALQHEDTLSVTVASESGASFRGKGRSGKVQLERLLTDLPEPEENTFCRLADRKQSQRQSVLFIITDGLETAENWNALLRKLVKKSSDIRLILVSTEEERNPREAGDLLLTDSETEERIKVTAGAAAFETYRKKRLAHLAELDALTRNCGAHFLEVPAEDGIRNAARLFADKYWIQ